MWKTVYYTKFNSRILYRVGRTKRGLVLNGIICKKDVIVKHDQIC